MGLLSMSGRRTLENLFTGAKLTPGGHAVASAVGLGMVGKGMMDGAVKQKGNIATGIKQAPQMGFDLKKTPNMGSSGALTMALSNKIEKR